MNNIRTFILCSSAALACWLLASYTYEPQIPTVESSETYVGTTGNKPIALEGPKMPNAQTKGQSKASELTTMAIMQGQ